MFYFQAGLIAMFLALSFNGFLNIGSTYVGSHTTPLPSPVYNCSVSNTQSLINISQSLEFTSSHSTVETMAVPYLTATPPAIANKAKPLQDMKPVEETVQIRYIHQIHNLPYFL